MLLFKAASGEEGAGEGGGMLLFWDGANVCSLKTCSLAPLQQKIRITIVSFQGVKVKVSFYFDATLYFPTTKYSVCALPY